MLPLILVALVKIVLVIAGLMTAAAYLVLGERWIAAWIQDRLGPNRAGIPLTKIRLFGLGQPLADGVKFLFKAEYTPAHVEKGLYFFAPMTIFVTALAVFAVIPFGSFLPGDIFPASWGVGPIKLVIAPGVDVGMIFVFAMGSIAVYGVVLGGWASNNKYSFLGGLRSSAQLIAYELPLGLGILGVVLASGSLRLGAIIEHQAQTGAWNAFVQPLGMMVFCVAAFAEAARMPFDLPECEQELIGGYHTEYFGIKLMMYLVGEYLHMVAAAYLIVILFFGGWHLWGVTGAGSHVTWIEAILRIVVLHVKVLGMVFFFMIARWSWARFRYDQLMSLAWLVMLPMGMVNLVYVAVWEEYGGTWARSAGLPPRVAMAVCGWIVLLATWFVATKMSPAMSDNRPRRQSPGSIRTRALKPRRLSPMNVDDKDIRWIGPPKLGMLGKSYLMLFVKGLTTALRHLFFHKKITLQSPDERHEIVDPLNYRGVHRLNKDEQGRVKCVACFLCATACPAHCIDIVAEPSPWPDREKYPKVFNIDELRCIFCGMCEQACPVEAIELTSFYDLTGLSREEMIFDKEKLLSIFDQTKDREPMPSKRAGNAAQDRLETDAVQDKLKTCPTPATGALGDAP